MGNDMIEMPKFLAGWTEHAASADAWLVEHVRNIGTSEPVFVAMAVIGTWVRLRMDDPLLVKEAIAKTMMGKVDETFAQPFRWVRAELTVARHHDLVRRVNARCLRLQEGFAEDVQAHNSGHIVDLLHDRDDVESIRLLLRQVTGCDELADAVKPLDMIGERYVTRGACGSVVSTDKRLRRIAGRFPESWWGRPAQKMIDV